MNKQFAYAPLASFQVHPEILKTYRAKDLESLRFTMNKYGQMTPVKVIFKEGKRLIVDGVSRFNCAKQLELPSLIYEVVEIKEDKVIEFRMLSNQKTKRLFTEMCLEAEYVLNIIGKSQGKKRNLLGFEEMLNDNFFGEVGKDRFDLACAFMGIDMKGSNLRKAMKVFWAEFDPDKKSQTDILGLLDKGRISIDRAYKLLESKEKKQQKALDAEAARERVAELKYNNKPYQFFLKSSLVMDEVPDDSVSLVIESDVYFNQRNYPYQDELGHGKEATVEEYIQNFKNFNRERYRKLKAGGVLVSILGESYLDGYKGVCTAAEIVLKEIGFIILDVAIWVKTNQKYTPHSYRFRNTYERIIIAHKPGAEPYFNEVLTDGSVDDFKVKSTASGGQYIARPKVCISNVITTPVHDPRIFKEIDPKFTHDAPCHPKIYEIFIEAYSKPEDTILDGFVGSGTVAVALKMGRKVIGYDVDPVSIEFAAKRCEWYMNQESEIISQAA